MISLWGIVYTIFPRQSLFYLMIFENSDVTQKITLSHDHDGVPEGVMTSLNTVVD